jgi:hypothetical protein
MAWVSVDEGIGFSVPGSVDTTAMVPLGTVARFRDPTLGEGTFIYLPGVASTAAGNVVSYHVTYGATGPTASTVRWAGVANTGAPLAVATAATVASTFGWYQVVGATICSISGTVAAGDDMFWQATATLSATPVASKQVLNAVATSAHAVPAAGHAIVMIAWPFAQGAIT